MLSEEGHINIGELKVANFSWIKKKIKRPIKIQSIRIDHGYIYQSLLERVEINNLLARLFAVPEAAWRLAPGGHPATLIQLESRPLTVRYQ